MAELVNLGEHYGWGLVLALWLVRESWPWLRTRLSREQDAAIEDRRHRQARIAQLDQRDAAALDRLIDQVLARLDLANRIQDSTRSELREVFTTNFSNVSAVLMGLQIDIRDLEQLIENHIQQQTERPTGRAPP